MAEIKAVKREEHPIPDYENFFDLFFPENSEEIVTYAEIDKAVRKYDRKENEWIYATFEYYLLDSITRGFSRYDKVAVIKEHPAYKVLKVYAEEFKSDYYLAFVDFVNGNSKGCMSHLKQLNNSQIEPDYMINEGDLGENYLCTFKNAYKGFWNDLGKVFSELNTVEYLPDLIKAIGLFYESDDSEEIRDALFSLLKYIPDGYIINELLAVSYEEDKMWHNAASYYGAVSTNCLFCNSDLFFRTAYASGKVRNKGKAIEYYRMCLEQDPGYLFARSNLAYELRRDKQYEEAKMILEEYLAEADVNKDSPELAYIVDNYALTLFEMGLVDEAKAFVKNAPHKVRKYATDRIEKGKVRTTRSVSCREEEDLEEEFEESVSETKVLIGAKKHQFTTEKILEDELENRILRGYDVFGMHLKMYDHDNDRYGRQYIIPIGMLDLLCEDDRGDFWIIELKRDSGYDDPLEQTIAYLEWFEKNKTKKGQKVNAIICLNDPSKNLVEQVRKDPRIKLYEYSISYTEIK